MNQSIISEGLHVSGKQLLEKSRWYGGNLISFLATASETGGAFSLARVTIRKGFEPPLHVHSREEESYFMLEGEVEYEAGENKIHAKSGDFILLPRMVPHSFKIISETASFLLLITPGGFEEMFIQSSYPALSLDLPPIPTSPPGKDFFENMRLLNEELGVTMFPNL